MTHNRDNSKEETIKAGTLMCPVCCVKYIEIEVDLECEGTILHNVKLLRCPICQEELFTPEQQDSLKTQITQTET